MIIQITFGCTTIVNADEFIVEARDQVLSEAADFFGYCWLQCPKTLIENQGTEQVYNKWLVAFITEYVIDIATYLI